MCRFCPFRAHVSMMQIILDKNKKIEKIAQIGNLRSLLSLSEKLLSVKKQLVACLYIFRSFRAFCVQEKKTQIFGIVGMTITSASDIIPLICAICVQKKKTQLLCIFAF